MRAKNAKLMPIFIALLAMLTLGNAPEQGAPIPPEIENEQIQGINKESPHATLMPYATVDQALAAKRLSSPFCKVLNGQWKFNWVTHPAQRPADFWKADFDVSAWKEIPVPSNWQILGYGTPYYRNAGYTFQKDWPRVLSEPPKNYTAYTERDPVGSYRHTFDLPADWNGRRVFITFDGVDAGFFLWINGEKVGYSVNSRCPAEFDVTKYVKPGKNILAAEVYRYCAGSYLEDQDMWRLSGIFRNVYLWSAPQEHIRDFFVKTDLDAQYKDAVLDVTVKVKNYGDQPAPKNTLSLTLYDAQGKPVSGAAAEAAVPELQPGQEQEIKLTAKVADPAKWTAETPNLYTTVLKLGDEIISARTGFRKVEIKGRVFCINGVPVKLKGANRHENWPDTGHYVTEEQMIEDLKLLKGCNSNHVRTCHYTDDPRWYELCDQWGIYLVGEANVECHGYYGVLDREPRWRNAIVTRNVENVEGNKNHASVVIWSLGNECGGGENFREAVKAIKAIDSTRPVHYEPFGIGENNPADIDSRMYTAVGEVERIGKSERKKPFYLCEYAHAMNNSMGSIGDYNDLFDAYEGLMGGAIWEWQDQALWNRRDPANPHLVYGGGFGEEPNDHYFICKGVVFADRTPTPKYAEAKRAYQWVGLAADDLAAGKLKIRNKYQFINLDRFDITWTLSEDGTVIDRGTLPRLKLAPLSEGTLSVPFKKIKPKPGADYYLRLAFVLPKDELWAKAGEEVAVGQFLLPVSVRVVSAPASDMQPLSVHEKNKQVVVSGKDFQVAFDHGDGAIAELSYGGKPVLMPGGGPKLNVWRAPHRNDDMWAAGDWSGRGLDALVHRAASVKVVKVAPDVVQVAVNASAENKGGNGFDQQITYTISGDGSIAVDQVVDARGERFVVARMGVRMFPDAKLDRFTWLGRGPTENYSDRKRGSDIGLYSSTVKEQLTPYVRPMECGNHEDVRWAALTGEDGAGLMAVALSGPFQASALPYSDEDLNKAEYAYQLPAGTGPVFCFSAKTLGVGSASCGPRPLSQYVVYSDPIAFSYVLRPVPAGTQDLTELARQPAPARVAPVEINRDSAGKVTLSCATPGVSVSYSIDDGELKPYTEPFTLKDGKLTATATAPGYIPLLPRQITIMPEFDRGKWKIVSADSFQPDEGIPEHAIDNDPNTYWHTQWSPDSPPHPHELVIDFGEELKLSAVVYQGRQEMENGRIRNYEIYLSNDKSNWGRPAGKGRFQNDADKQIVKLPSPVTARYLKIVALSEVARNNWTSIAELTIIPAK
ncbi:MAG: glycoside hydrolase family 2 TIM barrel-domain containing protein [Thermoguttaceae bacterium]|jgi:beta-galactosidase